MDILIDSVILIDHFNGVSLATQFLRDVFDRSCLSVITRAEVLVGYYRSLDEVRTRALLDRFPLLSIDGATADLAARLRGERKWKLPDAFQAALAQLHGLKLATRNTKDFSPERDEFVMVPYKL